MPKQKSHPLVEYIHQSPTPYHCVAFSENLLLKAGFKEIAIDKTENIKFKANTKFVIKDKGMLIAVKMGKNPIKSNGLRIFGAHTDSPNIRIKPNPTTKVENMVLLNADPYGGLLSYSWLDRDLGIAGQISYEDKGVIKFKNFNIATPIARIPSLAIHLNRGVNDEGLKLNKQTHLKPLFTIDSKAQKKLDNPFIKLICKTVKIKPQQLRFYDCSFYDLNPPTLGGLNNEFIFAARLDNQAMCHAGIDALIKSKNNLATSIVCLFDHEEVGSSSTHGAGGAFVEQLIAQMVTQFNINKNDLFKHSLQISADMAHALHPNYIDKHDKDHRPLLNHGPVIKFNVNQRYATTHRGASIFEQFAKKAKVKCQSFVNRSDLPCGSTIGPISSTRLGIETIDVGNPMLSMHSIREQAAIKDHDEMIKVLKVFFESKNV